MPTRLPLALLGCVLLAAPAAAAELYRWTDKDGVVHYTDQPPPEGDYEQRALPREADSKPYQPPAAEPEPIPRCTQARANVEVLENNSQVEMDTDGDGSVEALDAAAHARELSKAREQVTRFCTAAAPADVLAPSADAPARKGD